MLTVIGTVPMPEAIYSGEAYFEGDSLKINGVVLPVERGTTALIAAALRVLNFYGTEKIYCLLAGDNSGSGSNRLLQEGVNYLAHSNPNTVVMHYMFVLIKYGDILKNTVNKLKSKPFMIADAGGMYMAKASGIAHIFDLFTPDFGELAFLADPKALHPMYTAPDFYSLSVEDLVNRAESLGNIPTGLLVKGKKDFVFYGGKLMNKVDTPVINAMEAIGGTGDTLTGIASALHYLKVSNFAFKASLLNRLVGQETRCTPRTQIAEFIKNLDLSLLAKAGVEL